MTEPGAAFLSVLSTVSGQVALAGGIKGRCGPSKSFALSILLSLLLSTQEVPGRDPSGKWGWKVLRFHVKLCVVSDPATRGSPGNNQAEKALLSHSTLVTKHATVFAIS